MPLEKSSVEPIPIEILAYVAGLFDGEGCVNFVRSKNSRSLVLRAHIVNTDREILDFISSIFGGVVRQVTRRNDHWKTAYRLDFINRHASSFLEKIDPWLRIKSNQSTIAMGWEFLRSEGQAKTKETWNAYALLERQLTWLNKKGIHNDPEPMLTVLKEIGYAAD